MEEDKALPESVPYIVHEATMARNERHVRRLIITLSVCIALLFLSNALWLFAWTRYDYSGQETHTVTVDGKDGVANYIGEDGAITNGENRGQNR